jgi:hypothetical protein
MKTSVERAITAVPGWVLVLLVVSFALQVAWQWQLPRPIARAEALDDPPASAVLRAAALGEPIVLAQMAMLYLQAFDNQPGVSVSFRELDYARVTAWLDAILELDPLAQYPLLMAAQVYGAVADEAKQRHMCAFVRRQFDRDPDRRWRWLAHCALMAKHRLNDQPLALSYAEAIAQKARHASGWARQMRIFILADLGETESAKVLLGGLIESGEVTDPKEIHFLSEQMEKLEAAGKSSPPSKIRQPGS